MHYSWSKPGGWAEVAGVGWISVQARKEVVEGYVKVGRDRLNSKSSASLIRVRTSRTLSVDTFNSALTLGKTEVD